MDARQPWLWPRAQQHVLFLGVGGLGVLLLSPWWLQSWQAWHASREAQTKLKDQQEATQALRMQTSQLMRTQNPPPATFADAAVLAQSAQQQGLQLSHIGHDKPQRSPALNVLQMQQLPVQLKVQGSWDGWLNWLTQWPTAAPGATIASLELKADPRGGISAQVSAAMPQSLLGDAPFELASVHSEGGASADPFSAQGWATAQRTHAEQHPSYGQLVAPQLLRPRDVLEAFPRERLLYVGHIASRGEVEALVKVMPQAGAKPDAPMMSVHLVRVGSHLGQNFGKVLAIQPEQLVVQELTLTPTGEWQTREVRLPLQESAP